MCNRLHDGQSTHGVEHRADDAAVYALVLVMAVEVLVHDDVAVGFCRADFINLQSDHTVESDFVFKNIFHHMDRVGRQIQISNGFWVGRLHNDDAAEVNMGRV